MNHRLATLEIASPGRWPSFLAALAIACLPLLAHETRAHDHAPPSVPAGLEVPAGQRAFSMGRGTGTQDAPLPIRFRLR